MAEASEKQLDLLKKLTGKDYTNMDLTSSEASKRIKTEMAKKDEQKEEKGGASPPATNGNSDMSKEDWGEKQRIERESIESQTRAERITELWIADKLGDTDMLITKLRTWLEKLGPPSLSAPLTTVDEDFAKLGKQSEEIEGMPSLKNLGELYARAAEFGISRRDVCQANKVGSGEELKNLDEAWKITATGHEAQIKAKAAE